MPRLSTFRLTIRSVNNLPPKKNDYFIWDDQLKGFGVRVYPSGNKCYVVQVNRGGVIKRIQVGQCNALPLEKARTKARRMITDIGDGKDPNKEKNEVRLSPTVRQLSERFLKEYVPSHCKPRTQVEYEHALNKYILPAIGTTKVINITRDDASDIHHAMRDTPYQANRTLGVLSKMMNQAEVWNCRPDRSNPCYHIKKYKEEARERYLNPEELICLRKALDEEEETAASAVAAYRLLIFTGARLDEIQTLKWSYIQGDRAFLPDSKTDAKVIHLNKPALNVLSSIKRAGKNPYVITGKGEGAHLSDLQKPWRRIRKQATVLYWRDYGDEETSNLVQNLRDRLEMLPSWKDCQKVAKEAQQKLSVGLTDVRIHDLRRTFASVAVMTGESLPMIGKQLGHTQTQTTARYAHLADDPLRRSVQRVGDILLETMATE